MDILEIEQKETVSREEAAARLKRFAEMLSKNNDLEFERGGMQIQGPCPRRGAAQGGARARDRRTGARDRAHLVSRRTAAGVLAELRRLDAAVYAAIAETDTPALDHLFSRLSRSADYSRLSIASAGGRWRSAPAKTAAGRLYMAWRRSP